MAVQLGEETTTDDVISGVDLSGKTAVVTGGSAGLGVETARVLAGAGARVIMAARDQAKLQVAVDQIMAADANAKLETLIVDLADLSSVRAAAAELLERCPRIDLLINNAGVMACPLAHTSDGFELQFGTNHLGHFVFTCSLVPSLLAAAPARVVNLSSAGHKMGSVNLDDPNFEQREYEKWLAYGQSKTANVQFSVALNARLSGRGVTVNAVHPGMIMTELGRHLQPADIEALQARSAGLDTSFKSIPAGAATSVWAATSAELEGRGGLYLEDCHVAEPVNDSNPAGGYTDYALDAEAAEGLWQLSERLVKQTFEI
ncbi:SDR family NAD(P)-dependent oxidoreductase [Halieaceae bacterium IMCC14734]|uniref:SDR family NAD(P)-dependent oxidoreductase n=1 Tax=Candidatus Litorirhabdus singularis TaxID=2518993 RepID=A0ABT3TK39_9GAMM|nr:SDR family NAD(P)-dependent oxidoreductase [Candidatus Litorirhabdus singularis]MCX2982676.1 SDR family NAD(P)-dependent oxidoreductase [Candidatus Litorirhabdus singularis]